MNETMNIPQNMSKIIVSRNPKFLAGQSRYPFQNLVIMDGQLMEQLSSHYFMSLEEAECDADQTSLVFRINWTWEPGLEPEK